MTYIEKLHKNITKIVPFYENDQSEIYFQKLNFDGLEEMHQYSTNENFYEFFEFDAFKNLEETQAYLNKLIDRMATEEIFKPFYYWFIRRKIDNKLVGTAGLVNLNFNRKSVEWGYGVDPIYWGSGYILQIQEALKYYVFTILELNRLEGITMIDNTRTISALEATGMKNEGILREYYCKNDTFIDGWKYSMLKSEYLDTKKASNSDLYNNKVDINEVVKIIEEVLQEEVDENTTMYSSMSWDSINHMQIIVKLYENFNIKLSPIQIANATTVKSITTLINNL
jgi:RimJ/RimL family protein N-acetyltransferase/acyl carrier protein